MQFKPSLYCPKIVGVEYKILLWFNLTTVKIVDGAS